METLTNYIKNFAFENYEETPVRTPGGNVGDDFLQKVYDTSFMRSLNKSFTDQLIKEAEKKTTLKPDVEAYVIGYGLFGMLNEPVSLPEAEKRAAALLEKTEAARPAGCKQQVGDDSEEFNEWARGYAAVNFLVAVIAGQKKEYAKSAYHFLKAFKIHLVPTRTPLQITRLTFSANFRRSQKATTRFLKKIVRGSARRRRSVKNTCPRTKSLWIRSA